MSAKDVIIYITLVSNTLLWGGLGIAFLFLILTDPVVPDVGLDVVKQEVQEVAQKNAGTPRHRA